MVIHSDALLLLDNEPSEALSVWLGWEDSLTEKLKAQTGKADVELLTQQWVLPDWWDKKVLHVDFEPVFHREIIMWSGKKACWYARTVIPHATYQADAHFFNRLETESLGQLIFNNPNVKRTSWLNYPINAQSIEYHWLDQALWDNVDVLWARLSKFFIHHTFQFYLVEIFLPGLLTL